MGFLNIAYNILVGATGADPDGHDGIFGDHHDAGHADNQHDIPAHHEFFPTDIHLDTDSTTGSASSEAVLFPTGNDMSAFFGNDLADGEAGGGSSGGSPGGIGPTAPGGGPSNDPDFADPRSIPPEMIGVLSNAGDQQADEVTWQEILRGHQTQDDALINPFDLKGDIKHFSTVESGSNPDLSSTSFAFGDAANGEDAAKTETPLSDEPRPYKGMTKSEFHAWLQDRVYHGP